MHIKYAGQLKHQLILILFFFTSFSSFGQDGECKRLAIELQTLQNSFSRLDLSVVRSKTDSIFKLIPQGCEKATMIGYIVKGRVNKDLGKLEEAVQNFNLAYDYASENKWADIQKHILIHLSIIAQKNEEENILVMFLDSALKIPCPVDSIRCLKQNIRIKVNSATYLRRAEKYQESITAYIEGQQLFEEYELNDSIYLVSIFNGLGNIYHSELGDEKLAVDYYKKALHICPKNHNSRFALYNNIGNRYSSDNQLDSAEYYLNKTIKKTNNARYLVTPWQGMGDIEIKRGNNLIAIECYNNAIKNAEIVKNKSYINGSNGLLAKAYYLDGKFSEAQNILKPLVSYYQTHAIEDSRLLELQKYLHLAELAIKNPTLSNKLNDVFVKTDSMRSDRRIEVLNNSITRYEKIILKDSLNREVLMKENLRIKARNYQLGLLSAILFLFLSSFLVWKTYNSLLLSRKTNKDLVFENIDLKDLNTSLKTKIQNLDSSDPSQTIQFKSSDKIYNINCDEIQYIAAEDSGVRIYCQGTSYWTDLSLKSIKSKIPESSFVQIYRSTIVNLQHLEWVNHSSLKIKDGVELKIGRSFKDDIRNILNS